jgi:hypothetical protein
VPRTPGEESPYERALGKLTDADLALERMDAFDRLELAEYACEQWTRAPEHDREREIELAAVLDDALDAWLATRDEQARRRV